MKELQGFENSKLSLYTGEQLANIKSNPAVKATILSVVRAVPLVGQLVDDTMDAVLTKFQEKKRAELLAVIFSDCGHITSEMVNDVEFIINFSKTLEAVNRLATNDKVVYFGRLLKNGYLSEEKIKNDGFEEYLSALNMLSYRQITILTDLYKYEEEVVKVKEQEAESKRANKLSGRSGTWRSFMESIYDEYGIDREDLAGVLQAVSKTGFCYEITGAYLDYTGGVFCITKECRNFMNLILERTRE